ncbi:hypothetical protein [Clostridium gasigenes]|nr:hypothetical protein [Clostridium gasigenes]
MSDLAMFGIGMGIVLLIVFVFRKPLIARRRAMMSKIFKNKK